MMMSRRTLQILPMVAVVIVDDKVNEYYLHEVVIKKQNEDETPFKTGTSQKTTPSDASSSIYTLLEKLQNVNKQFSKNTFIDSEGNELTNEQQEYFKDRKVRDEDGNLLVVYHGTYEDFTVFDKTKGRTNMDIQGSFFSHWEIDAGGYGPNVKAYYLNITNPADEQTGYKALRKYQGQNGAGIKAREYLESLGYDGVNNGNEEYIAFNSNQIKLIDNATPTNKSDIRYSRNTDVDEFDENNYNVINTTGLKRYGELKSEVMTWDNIKYPNQVRCIELASKGFYMYKMLDNDTKDILVFKPKIKYARRQYNEIRRAYRRGVNGITVSASTLFENIRNGGYDDRNISRNGQGQLDNDATLNAESLRPERNSNGRGSLENDNNDNLLERLDKHSRNTRLNHDENFDDVNEAFEQALNVLQNIKGIDVSSEVVEEVGYGRLLALLKKGKLVKP